MEENKKKKISVFIDAGNIHHAQRANGWRIKFVRLKEFFESAGEIVGLYYFTSTPNFENVEAVRGYRKFKKMLILTGYIVKEKELKNYRFFNKEKQQWEEVAKANMDVEMGQFMATCYKDYEVAVIMSGDVDFCTPVEKLLQEGKKIVIIANANNTALELRGLAHKFIDLRDLKDKLT